MLNDKPMWDGKRTMTTLTFELNPTPKPRMRKYWGEYLVYFMQVLLRHVAGQEVSS